MVLRLAELFVRTLRDDPSDADVPSHRLLVRAGYIRRVGPGIYSWLPLGLAVLRNVEAVVREEMARIGGQEVVLPALIPREIFESSGRWSEYGKSLFRLEDRRGSEYLLGPTHEELFTLLVKGECSSYRDFPLTPFQIQTWMRVACVSFMTAALGSPLGSGSPTRSCLALRRSSWWAGAWRRGHSRSVTVGVAPAATYRSARWSKSCARSKLRTV